MFEPTVFFMVFMMLCFAGMAAMFYFILRALDELSRELRGERSQLVGLLQSMEASLDLLVKSAQISLKRQAAKEQTDREQLALLKPEPAQPFAAESAETTARLEKELTSLQMKVPAKEISAHGKGPLSLHIDNTK